MDKDYRKTLKWVNKWRRSFGDPELDEILVGHRASSSGCPIANSIGHNCLATYGRIMLATDMTETSLYEFHKVPRYVRRFMTKFDQGKYPELIGGRSSLNIQGINKQLTLI